MTPVADMRKFSLIPDLSVFRSQSDTSYESLAAVMKDNNKSRRASEWATNILGSDRKLVLRPMHANASDQREFSNLLYRRLSKVQPASDTSETKKGVSRSYSVKSAKKAADSKLRNRGSSIPGEGSCSAGGVKVKERTVSNRSLPLPSDESEYLRLRNFSVTSKGVINRGDSFRSKSSSNVPALNDYESETSAEESKPTVPSPLLEETKYFDNPRKFKVLLIGGSGVGKTSMRKQFMTSEYICANDFLTESDIDQVISVNLNNEESLMEFEEETWLENNMYSTKPDCPLPDAFVIVYSVNDRKSFSLAKSFLSQVEYLVDNKAVILVGNKTDLARLRVVTTDEGRSLAKDRGCKFIETSVAINHQIDELLVGTLTQIRIKIKVADKLRKKRESQGTNRRSSIYNGSKASGVLKKILRRACLNSKSCDNLHVL